MEKYSIAAGIVLFNPDEERFIQCFKSIEQEVEKVYLFDNAKTENLPKSSKIVYMTEHENKGLSYALNRIMEQTKKDGFTHVITMDQDSVIPEGMVSGFQKVLKDNIGIVCPQVIDERRKYMQAKTEPETEEISFCITSGSCTSVSAWENVGKFDEYLFIDLIDNDFCKRLKLSGYSILQHNGYILNQQIGNIVPKKEWKVKFWIGISKLLHNVNFAKLSYIKESVPTRVYYTCRNIVYLNQKMKNYQPVGFENFHCSTMLGFRIAFVLPNILRAKKKKEIISMVSRGFQDGKEAPYTIWEPQRQKDEK